MFAELPAWVPWAALAALGLPLLWALAGLILRGANSWLQQRDEQRAGHSRLGDGPPVARVVREFDFAADGSYAFGTVTIRGELWSARCAPELAPFIAEGDRVRVAQAEGLVLDVVAREDLC